MYFAISCTVLVLTLNYCKYKHLSTLAALHQVMRQRLLEKLRVPQLVRKLYVFYVIRSLLTL
jgi:hypothetical protein